ncbi:MAG: hypothetical protein WC595_00090 [Candidatus Nanoarchaeia archaeon]
MLQKLDLVRRLREYDFSKNPETGEERIYRARGFGNALCILRGHADLVINPNKSKERKKEIINKMYEDYGFIASSYASIDFEELEHHREIAAVDLLFEGEKQVKALGRSLNTFVNTCNRYIDTQEGFPEVVLEYEELRRTIGKVQELGDYRTLVKSLEEVRE